MCFTTDWELEIDKRTLHNVKEKRRTEREWHWRDMGSAMGRERREGWRCNLMQTGHGCQQIVLKEAFGHVEVGNLATWREWDYSNGNEKLIEAPTFIQVLGSIFTLSFGRHLALASCWMFKLVNGQNHEVGISWVISRINRWAFLVGNILVKGWGW